MNRITIQNLSKVFRIGFTKKQSVLGRLVSLFGGREPKKDIWALKDIFLEVKGGEILGIIGNNGSGKSTLLRIIAGVYESTQGKLSTNGNIISLISLGTGLEERLSMKDNIYLCCSLFGLGRKDIKNNLNSISKFAELDEYMETKIYQFSEGMKQRLSFSIAMHCNPEILLLDEVFEIGDESFKDKSAKKIKDLVRGGVSVLVVTHDLPAVEKHCDRVIWMDKGKIMMQEKPIEIMNSYMKK